MQVVVEVHQESSDMTNLKDDMGKLMILGKSFPLRGSVRRNLSPNHQEFNPPTTLVFLLQMEGAPDLYLFKGFFYCLFAHVLLGCKHLV